MQSSKKQCRNVVLKCRLSPPNMIKPSWQTSLQTQAPNPPNVATKPSGDLSSNVIILQVQTNLSKTSTKGHLQMQQASMSRANLQSHLQVQRLIVQPPKVAKSSSASLQNRKSFKPMLKPRQISKSSPSALLLLHSQALAHLYKRVQGLANFFTKAYKLAYIKNEENSLLSLTAQQKVREEKLRPSHE